MRNPRSLREDSPWEALDGDGSSKQEDRGYVLRARGQLFAEGFVSALDF